jgi:formamidopyrimidine-DNA glycosylase
MPELPEVETIVQGLRHCILAKQIISVQVRHKKPLGNLNEQEFKNFFRREIVQNIERWGKYIHFSFTSGKSMIVHLRMTGKFAYRSNSGSPQPAAHIRIIFTFNDKSALYFQDMRLFATFSLYPPHHTIREKQNLGPDPFARQITAPWFIDVVKNRKIALKSALLDQHVISGLGNIYVCEILHKAGIDPRLTAYKITLGQAQKIINSMRKVLKLALKYNGTTIRDFNGVDSKSGRFQQLLRVYQRAGKLCKTCGQASIQKIKQAQRSTFFCPHCQS